jgi:hypothetical protein
LTVAFVDRERGDLVVGWVGRQPLVAIGSGGPHELTDPHTLAREQAVVSEDHEYATVLTRALGIQGANFPLVEAKTWPLADIDWLLIGTQPLRNVASDDLEMCCRDRSAHDAVLQLANQMTKKSKHQGDELALVVINVPELLGILE